MKNRILIIVSILFLIVGRLCVPTAIDASSTSLYKDMAHIYWGWMVCYCWYNNQYVHYYLLIIAALFELFCALADIGGI